jgi:hypothetical protein
MSIDDRQTGNRKFTGRVLHPVVIKTDGKLSDIIYTFNGGPQNPGEDWTLPIDAYERQNQEYDILVQGRRIMAKNRREAVEIMNRYIDTQTGEFIDPGKLEEEVKNHQV